MARPLLTVAALAGAALLLTACETTDKKTAEPATQPAMGMLNTECPMSGEPVNPDAKTVSYGGHTIGFCCDACPAAWSKQSAAEKQAFIAAHTK